MARQETITRETGFSNTEEHIERLTAGSTKRPRAVSQEKPSVTSTADRDDVLTSISKYTTVHSLPEHFMAVAVMELPRHELDRYGNRLNSVAAERGDNIALNREYIEREKVKEGDTVVGAEDVKTDEKSFGKRAQIHIFSDTVKSQPAVPFGRAAKCVRRPRVSFDR